MLVVGAGPIGLGVALFARLSGAQVAVLDRDAGARSTPRRSIAGVDRASRPTTRDCGARPHCTDGEGFDVVFDATGSRASMEKGFDFVAHGGRYVLVSVVKEPITFTDPDFHRKEMTLLGSRNATTEDFERVIAAIRDGHVPVDRLITHRTNLAGAVRDIPRWAAEKTGLSRRSSRSTEWEPAWVARNSRAWRGPCPAPHAVGDGDTAALRPPACDFDDDAVTQG